MAATARPHRGRARRLADQGRNSTSWRNTPRTCPSRTRMRRASSPASSSRRSISRSGSTPRPQNQTDFEVALKIEGKAELPNNQVLFSFELVFAGIFRIQNVPQDSLSAVGDDRMPAAAVPVCAADHSPTPWRRRLPAVAARSGRFRRRSIGRTWRRRSRQNRDAGAVRLVSSALTARGATSPAA